MTLLKLSKFSDTNIKDREGLNMKKRIKATVRNLFLTNGMKYTARQINDFVGFSDSRKIISDLRKEGMQIQDYWNDNHTKTYFLSPDYQLNLWEGNSNG